MAVLASTIALCSAFARSAAASTDAAVPAIDAMCATSPADLAHPISTFVAIFDGRAGDGAWQRADPASLNRIAHDPNIYSETAHVWPQATGVVVVDIVADSLDFGSRTTYCFRASGTLARATETSAGTTNADRETRYLDEHGIIVARSSHISLLTPHGAASPSPDVKPAKIELYPAMSALPFAHLLATHDATSAR
jgi:hypothetical protein